MAWKILSALSALCLAGTAYFAWSNQKDLQNERVRLTSATKNLATTEDLKVKAGEELKVREEQLIAVSKDRDAAKGEVVKLAADAQEKEATLAVIKGNLEQISAQVASVEKQIEEAGDIEKLVLQIEKLKRDELDAQAAVANQNQRVALAKERFESITAQVTNLRETEAQGRRGIVSPDFSARIAQYFPEWDFAILSKGNSQGVFANADLEVKRGRNVIAKLKVRNVEQNGAIADLIPGSLTEGSSIRAGDTVVAAANQSAAKDDKTPTPVVPPTGDAAPMPVEVPADKPMTSDPFGAPMTPAPAPATTTDPFGAPPAAPATPAAPAKSDPFAN